MTLFLLIFRALQPWKYQLTSMKTENGLLFVGCGKKREIEEFDKILEQKHLEHLQAYIRKHG